MILQSELKFEGRSVEESQGIVLAGSYNPKRSVTSEINRIQRLALAHNFSNRGSSVSTEHVAKSKNIKCVDEY